MTFRVKLTRRAREAIQRQARYLAVEQQAPAAAERWLERVREAARTLSRLPNRCALAPETSFRPYDIRWLGVDRFMLLFAVDEATRSVWILFARHGRQLSTDMGLPERLPKGAQSG
ncbi:MAG: type II toxin-antitoxin system RelE/ParE family toxin [Acidobacteria bacterium]|nr:type II toxin-antitoxin system RelE/ParE family toxin [Acidobacteriota bacterium]